MSGSSQNANHMVLHNHVRLNVTVSGQPMVVPAQIGIMMPEKAEIDYMEIILLISMV